MDDQDMLAEENGEAPMCNLNMSRYIREIDGGDNARVNYWEVDKQGE